MNLRRARYYEEGVILRAIEADEREKLFDRLFSSVNIHSIGNSSVFSNNYRILFYRMNDFRHVIRLLNTIFFRDIHSCYRTLSVSLKNFFFQ